MSGMLNTVKYWLCISMICYVLFCSTLPFSDGKQSVQDTVRLSKSMQNFYANTLLNSNTIGYAALSYIIFTLYFVTFLYGDSRLFLVKKP